MNRRSDETAQSIMPALWVISFIVLVSALFLMPILHLFTRTHHGFHYYNKRIGVFYAFVLGGVAYCSLWFFGLNAQPNWFDTTCLYGFPLIVIGLTIWHQERSKRTPVEDELSIGITWPEYWGWRWAHPYAMWGVEFLLCIALALVFDLISPSLSGHFHFTAILLALMGIYRAFMAIRTRRAISRAYRRAERHERMYQRPERYR